MTLMKDPNYWSDESKLIEYLAGQLVSGRLALLLGAGISVAFGLPGWNELITRMSKTTKFARFQPNDNALRRAQAIKDEKFAGNESGFLDLVQSSLYRGVSINMAQLANHKLLAAIGSLVMSSRRGSASNVVTLNFDDVLETYLEYFGFDVASIVEERHWSPNSDVVIYHPHGFLPSSAARKRSKKIVLSSKEFLTAIAEGPNNAWRLLLLTLLRTHTCLHIGLSGEDLNVESLMDGTNALHAGRPREAAFNGVRFGLKAEAAARRDIIATSKANGVFTHAITKWDDLPVFLFRICQEARSIRLKQTII
jgi:hypothetical protein